MICPQCGAETPEGVLFCEECDWRMDLAYKGEKMAVNSVYFGIGSALLGIVSLVTVLFDLSIVALVTGALGMFLSGYTQTFIRIIGLEGGAKKKIMIMATVGILTAVVGFIVGFSQLLM